MHIFFLEGSLAAASARRESEEHEEF